MFPDLPSSTSGTVVEAVADSSLVLVERDYSLIRFQTYRLRMEMQHRDSKLWYSAEYWSFKIGDELNDKYRLNVSGYSGDAGDTLQTEGDWYNQGVGYKLYDGMMFSTYDQDNDRSDDSCASPRGGGWWFNRCEQCCLTCHWKKHRWDFLPGDRKRIAVSRMMIKPQ